MLAYLILFFLVIAIFMFIHKVIMKKRMEKTLGRKVVDRELTSLSAWMAEPADEDKKDQKPVDR